MNIIYFQYCSGQAEQSVELIGRRDVPATTGCSLCCSDDHCNTVVCDNQGRQLCLVN